MRNLQGTFPRCKKRLPSDPALCRLVIEAIVLVRMYGLKIENLQGYDQIAQYYFRPGEYDSEVDGEGIDDEDGGSDEE
jgi:hypothetical protein